VKLMISDTDILFVCLTESSKSFRGRTCLTEVRNCRCEIYFPGLLVLLLSTNYSSKEKEICPIFYFVHKNLKIFGISDFDLIEKF